MHRVPPTYRAAVQAPNKVFPSMVIMRLHDFENRQELLAHVASLYYDQELNQQDIANEIGVTRSAVSRLLSEAQKRGIVEHIVHYPWRTSQELEKELSARYKLAHVRVLVRQNKSQEEMLHGLGVIACQYFNSILPFIKVVGITWGSGLYQMIRSFRAQSRTDMEVVQLIGGTGTERGSYIGPLLAPLLAERLNCSCHFLHAPLILESPEAVQILIQDRSIRDTLHRGQYCDIALTGLGGVSPEIYNPYKLGYLILEEVKQLQSDGIVGDVAGLHYNIGGEILVDHWINRRFIGISLETLKKIKTVMAVAGGHEKGESIYGALQGEHVHVLVTDDHAAKRVLELYDQNR